MNQRVDADILPCRRHANAGTLLQLSLVRVIDTAFRCLKHPPKPFPSSETFFGLPFSREDKARYHDLDSEFGKLVYTLTEFPDRGPPGTTETEIAELLSSDHVLRSWRTVHHRLRSRAATCFQYVQKNASEHVRQLLEAKSGTVIVITTPEPYEVMREAGSKCVMLLERAVLEITLSLIYSTSYEYVPEFLSLYCFLRDPIGGLEKPIGEACGYFRRIADELLQLQADGYGDIGTDHGGTHHIAWKESLVQLAFESVYLSCPLLADISYIHFEGLQQLPYIYLTLDGLPKSELSIVKHVFEMVEEILESPSLSVAPIAVASYPRLTERSCRPQVITIDGNHRLTAVMLLRFLAEVDVVLESDCWEELLSKFCSQHRLDDKWYLVLHNVVGYLRDRPGGRYCNLIGKSRDRVRIFAAVSTIPALVVEEEAFHTACTQRSPMDNGRPQILPPLYQALYNGKDCKFVLPRAGQVHGRPLGFHAMPLKVDGPRALSSGF